MIYDIEEVKNLLAQKRSHKEIAELFGVKTKSIQSFCYNRKLKSLRSRSDRMRDSKIDDNVICKMVADDIQIYLIAKELGCSASGIHRRMKKMGLKAKRSGPKSGDRHTGWKGGIIYLKGYRYIYSPDHPNCTKAKRVAEHRLVMEQKLGRYLHPKEVVHHVNGDILDNRESNLAVYGCNGDHLHDHLFENKEHADKIRAAMSNPAVRKRISEGRSKSRKQT